MKAKPKNSASPLSEGLNLGPKSTAWLNAIGIFTLHDLRRVGSVPAFLELRRAGFKVSLVMLYAPEGALTNTYWLTVKREHKPELLAAIQ
jgi:TfoX/Sxy family transcriptional regulator of competence genes